MRNPHRPLHEAHATLGLAQERFAVALMSAARGELHRSVAGHGRRTSSSVSNAFTSKPATPERRTQRHATTPLVHHPELWCDRREDVRSALQDAAIAEPHMDSDGGRWPEPPAACARSNDVVEIPAFWLSRVDDLVRGVPHAWWNMREERRSGFETMLSETIDHHSRQWERDREWEREHEHDRDDLDVGR